jgi:hypothetical protein
MNIKTFDGFFFTPGKEDNELQLSFFEFNNSEFSGGVPLDTTSVGDTYHIAFFKPDDEGVPIFDESFEAVFSDPQTYINGLIGTDFFGCILRKTTKSGKWFNDYLTKAKESVIILKDSVKMT